MLDLRSSICLVEKRLWEIQSWFPGTLGVLRARIDGLRYSRWFGLSLPASVPVPVLHVAAEDPAIASLPQNDAFALGGARIRASSFQAGNTGKLDSWDIWGSIQVKGECVSNW
jgi:hypothetical protein